MFNTLTSNIFDFIKSHKWLDYSFMCMKSEQTENI